LSRRALSRWVKREWTTTEWSAQGQSGAADRSIKRGELRWSCGARTVYANCGAGSDWAMLVQVLGARGETPPRSYMSGDVPATCAAPRRIREAQRAVLSAGRSANRCRSRRHSWAQAGTARLTLANQLCRDPDNPLRGHRRHLASRSAKRAPRSYRPSHRPSIEKLDRRVAPLFPGTKPQRAPCGADCEARGGGLLLVIDDVWREAQVHSAFRPVLRGGQTACAWVTTRRRRCSPVRMYR